MRHLALCSFLTLCSPVSADAQTDPSRVIQYDEGIFGKVNIHDLAGTPVTTYSPLTFVKSPVYVSDHAARIAVDKGQKHFFTQDEDSADSRYVYNYIDRDRRLLEDDHLQHITEHLIDRVRKQGVDEEPLAKRIALARSYDLDILLNFRVNDVHWGGPIPARPELQSKFWLEHPEYYVNRQGRAWKDGAFNFAIPEVQEYLLQFYREAVDRFDNDGLLLDMMRNPTFFPPGTAERNRDHLTDFLRKVRAILDGSRHAGERRLTLGVRVPPTVEYCEQVGIDVRRWAAENLIDFLAVSTFIKQDPNLQVAAFREAVGMTDVEIYATIVRRNYGWGYSSTFGQFRAMAANMLGNEMAEGLLLFNFMQQERQDYLDWISGRSLRGPSPHLLNEIASLRTLAGRNKTYSIAWGTEGQYPDLPYFNPLPVKIARGKRRALQLGIYEDLASNQPSTATMVVQLTPDTRIDVALNGVRCRRISESQAKVPIRRVTGRGVKQKAVGVNDDYREREYLFLRVPLRALHDGLNSVELSPQAADSGGEMEIIRVDLFVGYGPEDTHGAF